MTATYCPSCERHLIDDRHPSCPVCADKATKRAAARVGLMQAVFGGRG